MNKIIKAKWIKALRSGRYKQAEGWLRQDGGYCCLGVLCQIIDRRGWDENDAHRGAGSFPDKKILAAAGVFADSGGDHPFWPLAYMNDEGKTFAEIADYIEQKL